MIKTLSTKRKVLNKYKAQSTNVLNIRTFEFGYYLGFRDWDLELTIQERVL